MIVGTKKVAGEFTLSDQAIRRTIPERAVELEPFPPHLHGFLQREMVWNKAVALLSEPALASCRLLWRRRGTT